jgi:hypothetical protein
MNEVKEANMPKDVERIMTDLFKNEMWSWQGMAQLFIKNNTPGDIDDFITCLQMERLKKAKK